MADSDFTAKDFYVYVHKRASDGRVFYVGKGSGRRAWSHHQRNRHWHFIQNKHGVIVEIVQDGMQEWWAFELEMQLIAHYGMENLANMSLGGEGPSGWVPSAEFRKKVSIAQTGRKRSPETIAKLKICALNKSPETRKKLSESLMGKPQPWHSGDKNAMRNPDVIEKRSGVNHHFYGKKRLDMSGENHHFFGKTRPSMQGEKHFNARSVICIETGVLFACINTAIEWLKSIGHTKARGANISSCCKGDRPRAYKYHWEYA